MQVDGTFAADRSPPWQVWQVSTPGSSTSVALADLRAAWQASQATVACLSCTKRAFGSQCAASLTGATCHSPSACFATVWQEAQSVLPMTKSACSLAFASAQAKASLRAVSG